MRGSHRFGLDRLKRRQFDETLNAEPEKSSSRADIRRSGFDALRSAWPLALILLLTIVTTLPVVIRPLHHLFSDRDPLDSTWRFAWAAHQLPRDPLHLFTANTFAPHADSYLFDEVLLGAASPVLPVIWLTGNPVLAFNLATLLGPLLSALGAYLLIQHLTRSNVGAAAGAVVYGFAPPHLAHMVHVGLNSAGWIPLALFLLLRLSERPTWWRILLLALAVAVQTLAAFYYGFYLAFLLPAALVVFLFARRSHRRFVPAALAAGLLAGGLVGPVAVTYVRVQQRYDFTRSGESIQSYSAALSSYLSVPHTNLMYGLPLRPLTDIGGDSVERMQFPGLVALALAGYGAWRGRRHWWVRFAVGMAVIAILFSFGPDLRLTPTGPTLIPWLPYAGAYRFIPGFHAMRAPGRLVIVVLLGMAILVGHAVATLDRRAVTLRFAGRPLRLAPLLIGALALETLQFPLGMVAAPPGPTSADTWLARAAPGIVVEIPFRLDRIGGNVTDYRSTFHWHPMLNGQADLRPPAFTAVGTEMQRFPDPRAIATLQALDVRYALVRFDAMSPSASASLRKRLDERIDGLRLAFADDSERVYTIDGDNTLAALMSALPSDASVQLASDEHSRPDAYLAALGWRLASHERFSIDVPAFGAPYPRPLLGQSIPYLLANRTADESAVSLGGTVVWENPFARLYRLSTR